MRELAAALQPPFDVDTALMPDRQAVSDAQPDSSKQRSRGDMLFPVTRAKKEPARRGLYCKPGECSLPHLSPTAFFKTFWQ